MESRGTIEIKVQKKDLFYEYLHWLDPALNLTDAERKVLSGFIGMHYTYRHYYDPEILSSLLFSEETKKDLAKRCKLPGAVFSKIMKNLEAKSLIVNNKIHENLTAYPKDGNFKINVKFKIQD